MKHLFSSITSLVLLFGLLVAQSCQNPDAIIAPTAEPPANLYQSTTIPEAKVWFDQYMKSQATGQRNSRSGAPALINFSKNPYWRYAHQVKFNSTDAVLVQFKSNYDQPMPRIRSGNGNRKEKLSDTDDHIGVDEFSDMIVYKKGDQTVAEVITKIPDEEFYRQKNKSNWKFSGFLLVSDLDGTINHSFRFDGGNYTGDVSWGEPPKSAKGRPANMYVCGYVDYYTRVCFMGDCALNYDRTDVVYCSTGTGGSTFTATAYSDASGGTASSGSTGGVTIIQVDADKPIVSIYQQIKCFLNNSDDYTYELTIYVDQPGDDADASWWFDPGHAFVGLKKTS